MHDIEQRTAGAVQAETPPGDWQAGHHKPLRCPHEAHTFEEVLLRQLLLGEQVAEQHA